MEIKETLSSVYLRSLASVEQEVDETLQVADGQLPPQLKGVLFRNGPGTREVFGDPYTHPFDGDGMITRFEFTGEKVHYRKEGRKLCFRS